MTDWVMDGPVPAGYNGPIVSKTTTVVITDEMLKQLEGLEDSTTIKKTFTPEADALILEGYRMKKKRDQLAEMVGKLCGMQALTSATMHRRYKVLTRPGKGEVIKL